MQNNSILKEMKDINKQRIFEKSWKKKTKKNFYKNAKNSKL